MATNDRFSELLWMPHSQHKLSRISENPKSFMNIRHHHFGIPYHPLCRPALENLGFFQLARMKQINVEKYLISALVECWRPETNSFHLPVGEMTVTLQDVSCLWCLLIQGKPITGKSDGVWVDFIERYLGIPVSEQHMKKKKRKTNDDTAVLTQSQYSICLSKLRDRFHVLPNEPVEREVKWHTRVLVLDILGSIVFTDTSGDGVPAMYLQFMEDLEQPTEYNWGAAVLAMLYRQLNMAAEKDRSEISGPLLLLQLWCWSHLPLGCPVNVVEGIKGGGEDEQDEDEGTDLDYAPGFGEKWCTRHQFLAPHNSGTEYYRNQIDLIRDGAVIWHPYEDYIEKMPTQVMNDRTWWFARVPLIHFWIIEFHYPDRVMHQFGLRQIIPPHPPNNEDEIRKLQKVKHSGGKSRNWEKTHAKYLQEYNDVESRMIQEDLPFDHASLPRYRKWFQKNGMYTVFLDSQCLGGLDDPIPYSRDTLEWTGYMPSGPPLARIGIREIKHAAWGIKCAIMSGCNKLGKYVLKTCVGNLRDLNLEHRLHNMLHEAGLPTEVEDIPSDDDDSTSAHPPSPPRDTNFELLDDWIYSGRGFTRYLRGVSIEQDSIQVTQDISAATNQHHNTNPVA